MSKLSENIIVRLDEFTARQGINSAEWCKLLDATEEHFQSLELELASTKKMLDEINITLESNLKMAITALNSIYAHSEDEYSSTVAKELLDKIAR